MRLLRITVVPILVLMYFSTGSLSDDTLSHDSILHSNARIYRGLDAPKNKYPFYVDLFITYDNAKDKNGDAKMIHGSGVLISKIHILTCAHSFYPYREQNSYDRDTFIGLAFAGGFDLYNNGTSELEKVYFHYHDVTLYPNNESPGKYKIIISFLEHLHYS